MLSRRRIHALQSVALVAASVSSSPSTATGAWRAEEIRVDGVPLSIRSVELEVARPRIAAGLLARWEAPGPAAPIVTAGEGRTVIGRQRGALHEAVSLTDAGAGRTRVVVTVRDLRIPVASPARPPPGLPGGMRMLRVVEHHGRGVASRTFSFDLRGPPARALQGWRRSMGLSGWKLRVTTPVAGDRHVALLWAVRGNERLEAVFSRTPEGTRVVMQVAPDGR